MSITEETTTQLAQEIEEIVRSLRRAIDDDDLIEELLRNPSVSFEKPTRLSAVTPSHSLSKFSLSRYSTH